MAEQGRAVMLLDVDGVLLDNDRYDAEWELLAQRAFVPLLGGAGAAWATLQEEAWQRVSQPAFRALGDTPAPDCPAPADWWRDVHAAWIAEACRLAGVDAPTTLAARADVAESALGYYFGNTEGLIPGAAEAISQLSGRFELHMASGNTARTVETVLERLGVRKLAGQPFGSDLAGAHKQHGVAFYGAVLAGIGGRPERFIVVDDGDTPLAAARQLGAITVKVGRGGDGEHNLVIDTLADLPAAIESAL